nr:MAG TPA: hypothetical protein [Caudoviricetes sp.]
MPVQARRVPVGVSSGVTCLPEATGAILTSFQGAPGRGVWVAT